VFSGGLGDVGHGVGRCAVCEGAAVHGLNKDNEQIKVKHGCLL
jgi:hypothetical protein